MSVPNLAPGYPVSDTQGACAGGNNLSATRRDPTPKNNASPEHLAPDHGRRDAHPLPVGGNPLASDQVAIDAQRRTVAGNNLPATIAKSAFIVATSPEPSASQDQNRSDDHAALVLAGPTSGDQPPLETQSHSVAGPLAPDHSRRDAHMSIVGGNT